MIVQLGVDVDVDDTGLKKAYRKQAMKVPIPSPSPSLHGVLMGPDVLCPVVLCRCSITQTRTTPPTPRKNLKISGAFPSRPFPFLDKTFLTMGAGVL